MIKQNLPNGIYLDWNIFQDIKLSRKNGLQLKQCINTLKYKRLVFPYSYSHIRDLSRSNEKYYEEDFNFIEELANNNCISYREENTDMFFSIIVKNPRELMNICKNTLSVLPEYKATENSVFPIYKVNTDKLKESNILIPFLKKTDGEMNLSVFTEMINSLKDTLFSDYQLQKQFRNSFQEVVSLGNPAFSFIKDLAFYKHLFSNEQDIEKYFKDIVSSFLSLSRKTIETIKFGELITTSFYILDFFPSFQDKISSKNTINNSSTDAEHALYATSCPFFISNDEHTLKKAKVVYSTFNISTKVLSSSEFLDIFGC